MKKGKGEKIFTSFALELWDFEPFRRFSNSSDCEISCNLILHCLMLKAWNKRAPVKTLSFLIPNHNLKVRKIFRTYTLSSLLFALEWLVMIRGCSLLVFSLSWSRCSFASHFFLFLSRFCHVCSEQIVHVFGFQSLEIERERERTDQFVEKWDFEGLP